MVIALVKPFSIYASRAVINVPTTGQELRPNGAGVMAARLAAGENTGKSGMKGAKIVKASGRDNELVGLLNVGNDVGGLPHRVARNRMQADGPVSTLA